MANAQSADLERGSSQYFTAADSASLDASTALTIALWVKLESAVPSNDTFRLVSKGYSANTQRAYTFDLTFYGTRSLEFSNSTGGSGGGSVTVAYTPPTGTWIHLAVTYASSGGTVKFYVNGAQQGTTQTGNPTSIFNGNTVLGVGADNAGNNTFDGLMDDVRMWTRTLSDTDIANLYADGCTFSNGANLAAWWEFESGAELTDSSGNGNTLTNVNTVTFSSDVPYSCSVGPTNLKTWNGVTSVNIKTIDALALASVKTVNGLT